MNCKVKFDYKPSSRVNEINSAKVKESEDVFKIVNGMLGDEIAESEHLIVITIDSSMSVIGVKVVAKGGLNTTYASPRDVFRYALLENAGWIIIAHNHPSGSLLPSSADIRFTNRMADAGRLIGVELVDHVIVTKDGWYSFAEEMPETVK